MSTKAYLLIFLVLTVVWACSTTAPPPPQSDRVIGAPPSPRDDPFFFVTMPAEAVPAAPSGFIGESAPPQAQAQDPDAMQCFSCVRICPLDGECSDREELICGWGVDATEAQAEARALAECDGALDIVRESPRFSRIEGRCPVPTCQRAE